MILMEKSYVLAALSDLVGAIDTAVQLAKNSRDKGAVMQSHDFDMMMQMKSFV